MVIFFLWGLMTGALYLDKGHLVRARRPRVNNLHNYGVDLGGIDSGKVCRNPAKSGSKGRRARLGGLIHNSYFMQNRYRVPGTQLHS